MTAGGAEDGVTFGVKVTTTGDTDTPPGKSVIVSTAGVPAAADGVSGPPYPASVGAVGVAEADFVYVTVYNDVLPPGPG